MKSLIAALILAGNTFGGELHAGEKISRVSQEGVDHIKKFEGFSELPYLDVAGKKTVGYGHLLKDGERIEKLTEKEAEALLRDDVKKAENAVERYVKVPLAQGQYDALVSFTYNVGAGNLRTSTLLNKINATNYSGAAQEFDRWVYAGGKKVKGLQNRRAREKALFLSDK